jgi:hypothetical protein
MGVAARSEQGGLVGGTGGCSGVFSSQFPVFLLGFLFFGCLFLACLRAIIAILALWFSYVRSVFFVWFFGCRFLWVA